MDGALFGYLVKQEALFFYVKILPPIFFFSLFFYHVGKFCVKRYIF